MAVKKHVKKQQKHRALCRSEVLSELLLVLSFLRPGSQLSQGGIFFSPLTVTVAQSKREPFCSYLFSISSVIGRGEHLEQSYSFSCCGKLILPLFFYPKQVIFGICRKQNRSSGFRLNWLILKYTIPILFQYRCLQANAIFIDRVPMSAPNGSNKL